MSHLAACTAQTPAVESQTPVSAVVPLIDPSVCSLVLLAHLLSYAQRRVHQFRCFGAALTCAFRDATSAAGRVADVVGLGPVPGPTTKIDFHAETRCQHPDHIHTCMLVAVAGLVHLYSLERRASLLKHHQIAA